MREQRLAIGHQEVEDPVPRDHFGQLADRLEELGQRRLGFGKALAQAFEHGAKRVFAIGGPHGLKHACQFRFELGGWHDDVRRVADDGPFGQRCAQRIFLQVAVVRKDPVPAPEFSLERVTVLEQDAPLRRLADMRNRVL